VHGANLLYTELEVRQVRQPRYARSRKRTSKADNTATSLSPASCLAPQPLSRMSATSALLPLPASTASTHPAFARLTSARAVPLALDFPPAPVLYTASQRRIIETAAPGADRPRRRCPVARECLWSACDDEPPHGPLDRLGPPSCPALDSPFSPLPLRAVHPPSPRRPVSVAHVVPVSCVPRAPAALPRPAGRHPSLVQEKRACTEASQVSGRGCFTA
jgi:hypothetical protein